MPDPTRAGRAPLRLVDPDVPEPADPFAAPAFVQRNSGPAARPLAHPPQHDDDGAELVWPSHWWATHDCDNRRRCPHRMPLPDWWLLMAKRGVPFHPDVKTSYQMALSRIATYKGRAPVFDEQTRLFVQGIVIDALVVAPQPVARGWVNTSLAAVGSLVRWALLNAEPLEREHLLSTHTRNRFLNLGCKDIEDTSVNNYRTRLDLIANGLSGTPVPATTTRLLQKGEPVDPHDPAEIASLWVWARGLRPVKRSQRLTATVVLGLGCGLRSSELIRVAPEHVHADADGVHVTVHGSHGTRLVTCERVWEERLMEIVANTTSGHPLTSPWRTQAATARGLQNAVRLAQRVYPPPVWFSARSLRNTWLTARLTAGTPIPILMEAAGIETVEGLRPFLAFVRTPTAAVRAASLRNR